jgi:Tfp pilus assembly ATPase PilU
VQLSASHGAILAQRLIPRIGGGMVAPFEVLIATNPVRKLIREGRSNQLSNVMTTNQKERDARPRDQTGRIYCLGHRKLRGRPRRLGAPQGTGSGRGRSGRARQG